MDVLALDQESAEWVRDLAATGEARDDAIARLHALLLRVTRTEAARRSGTLPARPSDDIDHLCVEAANDALIAILSKFDTYRGNARFTTWACKFAIYEASSRLRRYAWRERKIEPDDTVWDRLADRRPSVLQYLENDQLVTALHNAIRDRLTERQRLVFQSVTMDDVPIDVLAERLGSTRGAIYKTLHDARANLRRALTEAGHGDREP